MCFSFAPETQPPVNSHSTGSWSPSLGDCPWCSEVTRLIAGQKAFQVCKENVCPREPSLCLAPHPWEEGRATSHSCLAWAQQQILGGEGKRWGLAGEALEAPADPSHPHCQNVPGHFAVGRRVYSESISLCLTPSIKVLKKDLLLVLYAIFYIFL